MELVSITVLFGSWRELQDGSPPLLQELIKSPRTKKTEDKFLQAFEWLPLDRWNEDTLIGPNLPDKGMCKVCDTWIDRSKLQSHIDTHIKEMKVILAKIREEKAAEAAERRRLKKELKDAGVL